ncbi:ARM repeat-containing protein [Venustampulla echinocandica]|uniref:ARM repeat-containing protein n=1 Tax=Venustampulla echinocandica TaxID=2656787 RepID=A0A370TRC7_9HELO|nr:ARM repeat-containing protein [Venustampulla echinocandica]RDL38095.1 ARM repeat-containing protein [Venustampulla echinocandica]
MRDLRRQALESGKTVSRKAQSRISSRASSATNSRATSRNPSRHASDDDEENMSDSTNWSVNSLDEMLSPELPDDVAGTWKQGLADRIEEIIDRKRSSVQGRESTLNVYVYYLMSHYCGEEIENKASELFPALLKSVKMESSEKETCLALRAIALTLITNPSETAYDGLYQPLKRAYTDSEFHSVKATAIHTLSAAAVYGGASDSATEDAMDDLLEIIESDGTSVAADDSGEVVTAACQAWGFLATFVDDLEDKTEPAADVFVEQLDSSDTTVQVAAGENIALLYEKSYTPREANDEPASDGDDDDESATIESHFVKRYEVYRQKHQLQHTLSQLATESSKRIAKKDRKTLHVNFADILNTIEHPALGPRYSMARDPDGRMYGSRMTIRVHKAGIMRIDKWWKLHRLQALKRLLGGGFVHHYQDNEVVFDSLPIMIQADNDD